MTLTGARIARNAASTERADLHTKHGRIQKERGFWASPGPLWPLDPSSGLINSHDHLEFNLCPRLGRGPYPNATAWAEDIYHPDRSPVKEHLAVPKPVRFRVGRIEKSPQWRHDGRAPQSLRRGSLREQFSGSRGQTFWMGSFAPFFPGPRRPLSRWFKALALSDPRRRRNGQRAPLRRSMN